MKIEEKLKSYCPACYKHTNHHILYFKGVTEDEYPETTYYSVIQCLGCDYVSYMTKSVDEGAPYLNEYEEWEPSIEIKNFPKVLKKHRYTIRKHQLPTKIGIVYDEAIKAFSSECYLLTGVAFRAIVEAICIDKAIAGKDLNAKISNLAKSKLITENEAERLHPIRFMGNDSVHEMTVPTTNALYTVLNIIEHLLNNIYIIDGQIKHQLETVISNFEDFKILLNNKLHEHQIGEILPLSKILGKSYRRLNNKVLEFETELQKQIDDGQYLKLTKGDITPNIDPKKTIQNYVIKDNEEELPF